MFSVVSAGRFRGFRAAIAVGFVVVASLTLSVGHAQSPGSRSAAEANSVGEKPAANHVLLIVLDGLRPDHVTAELTPNLNALADRGVRFEAHHASYPTVTRVNSAALTTGSYPSSHGLMGNIVFYPEISSTGMTTGNSGVLARIDEETGGRLMTAPTLGQLLNATGRDLLVVSAFESGAAYLFGYKLDASRERSGVINADYTLPAERKAAIEAKHGVAPRIDTPMTARNRWTLEVFFDEALDDPADVTVLWLGEPDQSQHERGIGHPEAVHALRDVDADVGKVLAAIEERGLAKTMNVIVVSDHGFSTFGGGHDLPKLLVESGVKQGHFSKDVVVVDNEIYVEGRDREKIREVIDVLQRQEWVGPIFTHRARPTHPEGFVPGTLSLHSIHRDHERGGDIIVTPKWSSEPNEYGVAGTVEVAGIAGHGTTSPFETHATLLATGPDFKRGVVSSAPTGNIDIAPTILALLGVERPTTMDGRVVEEALNEGPADEEVEVLTRLYRSRTEVDGAPYVVNLREHSVGGADYLHSAWVQRADENAPASPFD